jgi:TetR/AcrR family transcriptional repressor of mexJK operon
MTMATDMTAEAEAPEAGSTRGHILAVAEATFVAEGFHATRMDVIAQLAGCSKKTIYKLFGSKEALFTDVLRRTRGEVTGMAIDTAAPPEQALQDFLLRLAGIMLRSTSIALTRIVMSEAGHDMGRRLRGHEDDSALPRLALESYLQQLEQNGGHDFGDPGEATRMLVGMSMGAFHHETLIGVLEDVPDDLLRERIRRAVRIFLRGARRDV